MRTSLAVPGAPPLDDAAHSTTHALHGQPTRAPPWPQPSVHVSPRHPGARPSACRAVDSPSYAAGPPSGQRRAVHVRPITK